MKFLGTISFLIFVSAFSKTLLADAGNHQLIEDPKVRQVSLSPDGRHLAIVRNLDKQQEILIVKSETLKASNQILLPENNRIGKVVWASDERIVFDLTTSNYQKYTRNQRDDFDKRINRKRTMKVHKAYSSRREFTYTDLYAIDIDKQEGKFVFGKRSIQTKGKDWQELSLQKRQIHQKRPRIVSGLINDADHIIIRTHSGPNTKIYRVNIHNGSLTEFSELPIRTDDFLFDDATHQLWAKTYDRKKKQVILQQLNFDTNQWSQLKVDSLSRELKLLGYDQQQKQLLIKDYCENDTLSICSIDLTALADKKSASAKSKPKSKSKSKYRQAHFGIDSLIYNSSGDVLGYLFHAEYPEMYFDKKVKGTHSRQIYQHFKGRNIKLDWAQNSDNIALVQVNADAMPATWFIYHSNAKSPLNFVTSEYAKLDNKSLAQTFSFNFDASDGVRVQGYVTLPKQSSSPAPAIVIINDDLYNKRFTWQFDNQVQYLSSLGYAVVQINHRGTLGFGEEFKDLGRPLYTENLQFDIADALAYLANNEVIDSNKVCIMGGKIGGEHAIKNVLAFPEQYRCVIADSARFNHHKDEKKNRYSLVKRAGEINVPVLLMFSKQTQDLEQANFMLDALQEKEKSVEVFEREDFDYFLDDEQHRLDYFSKVSAFLLKHNPVK